MKRYMANVKRLAARGSSEDEKLKKDPHLDEASVIGRRHADHCEYLFGAEKTTYPIFWFEKPPYEK